MTKSELYLDLNSNSLCKVVNHGLVKKNTDSENRLELIIPLELWHISFNQNPDPSS